MKPDRTGVDALRDDLDRIAPDARRAELRDDRIMADFAAGTPLMEAVIQPDAIEALLMVRGLDSLDAAMQPTPDDPACPGLSRKSNEPPPAGNGGGASPADLSPEDPGDLDDRRILMTPDQCILKGEPNGD